MSTDGRAVAEPLLGFADSLPTAAVDAAAPAATLHLLTFTLDREEFGIPVTQVREVIRVDGITRVPQVPAHVRGVTNLRGRILAVVEIRTRLGLTPAVVTPARVFVATAAEIASAPAPMPTASETEAAVASAVLDNESVALSITFPSAVTPWLSLVLLPRISDATV